MSDTLRYQFDFRANASGRGTALGFATVKIFIGDLLLARLEQFTVREGQNGLWLAPPSRSYQTSDGQTKYQDYIKIWPKPFEGEADNSEASRDFEEAFAAAWEQFCAESHAAEQPKRPAPAPARQAPRPTQRVAPAQPVRTVSRPAPARQAPAQPEADLDIFSPEGGDAWDNPPVPTKRQN